MKYVCIAISVLILKTYTVERALRMTKQTFNEKTNSSIRMRMRIRMTLQLRKQALIFHEDVENYLKFAQQSFDSLETV